MLLKKKNNSTREYGRKRYKNLSETEKQGLVAYRRRYYEMFKKEKRLMFYDITKKHLKDDLTFSRKKLLFLVEKVIYSIKETRKLNFL